MVDWPDSQIISDGMETHKTLKQSNNEWYGTVEIYPDGPHILLLGGGERGGLPKKYNIQQLLA